MDDLTKDKDKGTFHTCEDAGIDIIQSSDFLSLYKLAKHGIHPNIPSYHGMSSHDQNNTSKYRCLEPDPEA